MTHLSAAGFTRSRDAIAGFHQERHDACRPRRRRRRRQDGGQPHRIGQGRAAEGARRDQESESLALRRRCARSRASSTTSRRRRSRGTTSGRSRTPRERACREQPGECSGAGGDAGVRQQIESKGQRIAAETQRDTSLTLTALESLANGLARLPGPEAGRRVLRGLLHRRHERLAQSTSWGSPPGTACTSRRSTRVASGRTCESQNFLDAAPVTSSGDLTSLDTDANADVLTSLALDTGGDRVFNYNNFREPLDKLARETSTYYVIGYRPSRAFDGSYRRLEVKVLRPAEGMTCARPPGLRRLARRRRLGARRSAPLRALPPPAGTAPAPAGAPEAGRSLPVALLRARCSWPQPGDRASECRRPRTKRGRAAGRIASIW